MSYDNLFTRNINKKAGDPPQNLFSRNISNKAKNLNAYMDPTLPMSMVGSTGVGNSIYDFNAPFSQLNNLNEIRAQRQPWIAKASSGVARIATKALTEIAKIPGVAGGIVAGGIGQIGDAISGEDNTDFMEVAFDNPWVKALNDLNEYINNEALPVYVRKAVSEGNLWKNITSIDFWATDGADGLGYIVAMLAPGALINRIGVGGRIIGLTGKAGRASNIAGRTDDAVSLASRMASYGLPTNARNIDLYAATISNTILEAGLEAQQAMEDYSNTLQLQLESGEIDQWELEDKLQHRSTIGANIFGANAAILLGPNAIMSKILWGGAKNIGKKGTPKFINGVIQKEAAPTFTQSAKTFGGNLIKGGAVEGFWEEGMQETAGNFFGDNPTATLGDFVSSLPSSYADMIGTVDGQKAIFLGAVFGGLMSAGGKSIQASSTRDSNNELIDYTNEKLTSFFTDYKTSDVYHRNEDGTLRKDVDGDVDFDYESLISKMENLTVLEQLSSIYDEAVNSGKFEMADQIEDIAMTSMITPFLKSENLDINSLNEYLKEAPGVEQLALRSNISKQAIIDRIMNKARYLKDSNDSFSNFAQPLINVQNENATSRDLETFYNGLQTQYLNIKGNRYHVDNRLNELNNELEILLNEKGTDLIKFTDNKELANNLKDNDSRIKDISDKLDIYNESKRKLTKQENDFWNPKLNQKKFDEKMGQQKKVEESLKKKEKVKEVLDRIDSSTTLEELNNISKTNTLADKVINYRIAEKRAHLEAEITAKKNQSINKEKENSQEKKENKALKKVQDEDLGNWIATGFNVGEFIPLTRSQLEPYSDKVKGKSLSIVDFVGAIESSEDITDTSVKIMILETGEILTIPRIVPVEEDFNEENNFVTEGSENHDLLIPVENENNEDKSTSVAGTGAIIISTNKETGNKQFDNILDSYLKYEKNPSDKTGTTVNFQVNENEGILTDTEKTSVSIYNRLLNGEQLTQSQIDLLIDYLPLNALVDNNENYMSPIHTKPFTANSVAVFNKSTRELRRGIITSLLNGKSLDDITTIIEGQYTGILKVDTKDKYGKVKENNILELYHFGNMTATEKLEYVKENLAFINQLGKLVYRNGNEVDFFKEKSKGEIYLMIPMANGKPFPLKLNIKKLSSETKYNSIIADIYELMINNKEINSTTSINQLGNQVLIDNIKRNLTEEQKLIGKSWRDMTINDLISLVMWDNSQNIKSRVGFVVDNDPGVFVYGNPKVGGRMVNDIAQFDKAHFMEWLAENKRFNIRFKKQKTDTMDANIESNDAYIQFLLDNNILNTNAVVNEPTFQGYTNIFLKSDISDTNKPAKKVVTKKSDISDQPTQVSTLSDVLSINELSREEQESYNREIKAITQKKFNELVSQGMNFLEAAEKANDLTQTEQNTVRDKYLKVENTSDNNRISQDNNIPLSEEAKDRMSYTKTHGGVNNVDKRNSRENFKDFRNEAREIGIEDRSGIGTVEKGGKKYRIVSVKLDQTRPDIRDFINENGGRQRTGNVYVAIEMTENTPDNIDQLLVQEAVETAKEEFTFITDWKEAIVNEKELNEILNRSNEGSTSETKESLEKRRKEELESLPLSNTRTDVYNASVMEEIPNDKFKNTRNKFIPFAIVEAANKNNKISGQTAQEISDRGGYSTSELDSFLPKWRNMLPGAKEINSRYDAKIAKLQTNKTFKELKAKEAEMESEELVEEDNSLENKALVKSQENIKVKDKITASPAIVNELMGRIIDNRLLKDGSLEFKNLMKESNQGRFESLVKIAKKNKLDIENILIKC